MLRSTTVWNKFIIFSIQFLVPLISESCRIFSSEIRCVFVRGCRNFLFWREKYFNLRRTQYLNRVENAIFFSLHYSQRTSYNFETVCQQIDIVGSYSDCSSYSLCAKYLLYFLLVELKNEKLFEKEKHVWNSFVNILSFQSSAVISSFLLESKHVLFSRRNVTLSSGRGGKMQKVDQDLKKYLRARCTILYDGTAKVLELHSSFRISSSHFSTFRI